MEFTFFADLTGISSLYRVGGAAAYNALDVFYNCVFNGLSAFHRDNMSQRQVKMLSDSLLVTGENITEFVQTMAPVYANLLKEGLMLRGGAVKGRLSWDLRIETPNFKKLLPETGVLARAASMEKMVKGARFLLDHDLAHHLLGPKQEWQSEIGYAKDPCLGDRTLVLQRSIVPLPTGDAYEVIYPILAMWQDDELQRELCRVAGRELGKEEGLAVHYRSTSTLLKIARARMGHQKGVRGADDVAESGQVMLQKLLEVRKLPIRAISRTGTTGSFRLDWAGNRPNHGGVYAFWWDGAGQSSIAELAAGQILHFKGPHGVADFSLEASKLLNHHAQNGHTPLYVGKSFGSIAVRIGQHLCLGSPRTVPKEECNGVSKRKRSTCQLRDRLDRLFPNMDDTRPLLEKIRVSWIELCGEPHFAERFFLEDLAIGIFRPAFNVDTER